MAYCGGASQHILYILRVDFSRSTTIRNTTEHLIGFDSPYFGIIFALKQSAIIFFLQPEITPTIQKK